MSFEFELAYKLMPAEQAAVMEEATAEMARQHQDVCRDYYEPYYAGEDAEIAREIQRIRAEHNRHARRYLFALIGDGRGEDECDHNWEGRE